MFTIVSLIYLFQLFVPQPAFEKQTLDANISIGYGLALGDVDGDGKPDILLADKKQFVWYRNGDWKKFVMVENLTQHDNVCIAARDINGDGKVEVAVGAQWNPSETSDSVQSGSVHYLSRPQDPTQLWTPVKLQHEPTIHRMKWVKSGGQFYLVVVPLHGRENKNGEGRGVKILAYEYPKNVNATWPVHLLEDNMHLTHNLELSESGNSTQIFIAGKEGIRTINKSFRDKSGKKAEGIPGLERGAGEVRIGKLGAGKQFIATIEPMHGQEVAVYLKHDGSKRIVLDDDVKEGHALAAADFLGAGRDQVVAGWRSPDKEGKIGIKLYVMKNAQGTAWDAHWIDDNGMACEDIQVMDLNGDNKPDIVASGRSTRNLNIYWNKSGL